MRLMHKKLTETWFWLKNREYIPRWIRVGLLAISLLMSTLAFWANQSANEANKQASTAQAANTYAVAQQATAESERKRAEQQAQIALGRQLATQSQMIEFDRGYLMIQSGLLAVEAKRRYLPHERLRGQTFGRDVQDGAGLLRQTDNSLGWGLEGDLQGLFGQLGSSSVFICVYLWFCSSGFLYPSDETLKSPARKPERMAFHPFRAILA